MASFGTTNGSRAGQHAINTAMSSHDSSDKVATSVSGNSQEVYCLVKSCPVSMYNYTQMVNTAGSLDFGQPFTLVVLPYPSIQRISVIEELRSVLAAEATCLDAKNRSVWRLLLDSLSTLNTLSKLGFRASHFDVNPNDGVHTWTLMCSVAWSSDDSKQMYVCVEPVSRNSNFEENTDGSVGVSRRTKNEANKSLLNPLQRRKKSVRNKICAARKTLLHAASARIPKHVVGRSTAPVVDEDAVANSSFTDISADSADSPNAEYLPDRLPASVLPTLFTKSKKFARALVVDSDEEEAECLNGTADEFQSDNSAGKTTTTPPSASELIANAFKVPVHRSSIPLKDFFVNPATMPRELFDYYVRCSRTLENSSYNPKPLQCLCKSISCQSNASVAGRRYCHYALDSLFQSMRFRGFELSRLCRRLLTMIYELPELCCMTLQLWPSYILMPESHVEDIQAVMAEYWNAYVGHGQPDETKSLTKRFVRQNQPSTSLLKRIIGKLFTDSRHKIVERQNPKQMLEQHQDVGSDEDAE